MLIALIFFIYGVVGMQVYLTDRSVEEVLVLAVGQKWIFTGLDRNPKDFWLIIIVFFFNMRSTLSLNHSLTVRLLIDWLYNLILRIPWMGLSDLFCCTYTILKTLNAIKINQLKNIFSGVWPDSPQRRYKHSQEQQLQNVHLGPASSLQVTFTRALLVLFR